MKTHNRHIVYLLVSILASTFLATTATAQQRAGTILDLEGMRASAGESVLRERGYRFVGSNQSEGVSFTFWREPRTDRCVSIRTANGVYEGVIYAPTTTCARYENEVQAAPPAATDDGSFGTVCGVIINGQANRFSCRLRNEGCHGEGYCRTFLTFPDMDMRLDWKGDDGVEVRIEGLAPQTTTTSFVDGQTRFDLDGKTYFVYRSEDRARRELAKLGN